MRDGSAPNHPILAIQYSVDALCKPEARGSVRELNRTEPQTPRRVVIDKQPADDTILGASARVLEQASEGRSSGYG